jgi:acylphosphatase
MSATFCLADVASYAARTMLWSVHVVVTSSWMPLIWPNTMKVCNCSRVIALRLAIASIRCGTMQMKAGEGEGVFETRLVRVHGLVQGIGYREACVRHANTLDVTGWVRNRMDGSVEVMLQGSPEQLAQMCAWLSEGMSAAIVDQLEVTEIQPPFPRFDQFQRLPTL